jgi:hypothetical protein
MFRLRAYVGDDEDPQGIVKLICDVSIIKTNTLRF